MDLAIPPALRCPRTRNRRIEDDYAPPYPAWVARAEPLVSSVVMGYFGVQSHGATGLDSARTAFSEIVAGLDAEHGALHHELAHYRDAEGFDNSIAVGYWTSRQRFERWRMSTAIAGWWDAPERLRENRGYFREILYPPVDRFETLFSAPQQLEGVGVALGAQSAQDIQEHGYWGSMRDRFALSQTDAMLPSGALKPISGHCGHGQRTRLTGSENVAVIRSGQDWSDTRGRERELYLKQMEPVLREGMEFLCTQGQQIGCLSNRYLRQIDRRGAPLERSFGLSFWRSLSTLERWSESHPTHIAIFGTFMRIVQELNFQLQLRLFHEVSVLKSDQQEYEYVNCHAHTGLQGALTAPP